VLKNEGQRNVVLAKSPWLRIQCVNHAFALTLTVDLSFLLRAIAGTYADEISIRKPLTRSFSLPGSYAMTGTNSQNPDVLYFTAGSVIRIGAKKCLMTNRSVDDSNFFTLGSLFVGDSGCD
jgi:hypothetical protein